VPFYLVFLMDSGLEETCTDPEDFLRIWRKLKKCASPGESGSKSKGS
jgi:hypothetical protein